MDDRRHSSIVAVLCASALCTLLCSSRQARATQPADAEALFREAKADVDAGRVALACPKFKASYELSGVAGALLSWADCESRQGHLRLSRRLWNDGAKAVARDPERVAYVAARIVELDKRMARVRVTPSEPPVALAIDGEPFDPAHGPVVLDPGAHEVGIEWTAGQEQRVPFSAREGESVTLQLTKPAAAAPALPIAAKKTVARAPERGAPSSDEALRVAGWIAGGAGVAAGIAFAGTAVVVATQCKDSVCPDELGGVLVGNAVAGSLGVAGLGLGALFLGLGYGGAISPSGGSSLSVQVGPSGVRLGLAVEL